MVLKKCSALALLLCCAAARAETELCVFAASSLTEALAELCALYEEAAPDVLIRLNFDSSGALRRQIDQGAACDLFLSAGQAAVEGLACAPGEAPFDLASNELVLIAPTDSDGDIRDFSDLLSDRTDLMSLGGPDVPAGQYAKEALTSLGLWDALADSGRVSYAGNVREVLAQVESHAVDCGVVYATDARGAPGVKIVARAPRDSHRPVVYPALVPATSEQPEAARAFATFLRTERASEVLKGLGFRPPSSGGDHWRE